MHTITTTHLSPLAVAAARRVDDNASVNSISASDWLTGYWRARISATAPRNDCDLTDAHLAALAAALARGQVDRATYAISDYRESTGRAVNDETLTRMMLDALLDWSRWTGDPRIGDPRIDDARAQDWLRSLLA